MRWVPFAIVAYALIVLQTTFGRFLSFGTDNLGRVGPDLLAIAAVFLAVQAMNVFEVMIAAWVLGLILDLTTGTAGGMTVVGPMAISYALAAGFVFKVREAVFSDQVLTQVILGFVFCLIAHGAWIFMQSALTWSWSAGGRLLVQAMALAIYTGLLTPILFRFLYRMRGLLIQLPARRTQRSRGPMRR